MNKGLVHIAVAALLALLSAAALLLAALGIRIALADSPSRPNLRPFTQSAHAILGDIPAAEKKPGLRLRTNARGRALAVTSVHLAATDYGLLRYTVEAPDTLEALFLWRRADAPRAAHSVALAPGGLVAELRDHPEWRGTIIELGVMLDTLPGITPVKERTAAIHLSLRPSRLFTEVLAHAGNWFGFERWAGVTINHLGSSLLPALLVGWAALGAILGGLIGRQRRLRTIGLTLAVGLAAGWLVLEGLWVKRLLRQAALTQTRFTAPSLSQRLLQGSNQELVQFTQQVQTALAAYGAGGRVYFLSDVRYYPERARYLLLPWSVIHLERLPELKRYRQRLQPGDAVVVSPEQSRAVTRWLRQSGFQTRTLVATDRWEMRLLASAHP